ncbi:hypothetical protein SBDP1_220026 [Syntrophobacter sp. SbD1]|nr:hypothetical protein SBDP1_220026 [Syntrophobacter sp. SbD1]
MILFGRPILIQADRANQAAALAPTVPHAYLVKGTKYFTLFRPETLPFQTGPMQQA